MRALFRQKDIKLLIRPLFSLKIESVKIRSGPDGLWNHRPVKGTFLFIGGKAPRLAITSTTRAARIGGKSKIELPPLAAISQACLMGLWAAIWQRSELPKMAKGLEIKMIEMHGRF